MNSTSGQAHNLQDAKPLRDGLMAQRKSQAPAASRRRQRSSQPRSKPSRQRPRRRCVTRQAPFLAAYRKTASIAAAAHAAGIKPAQHQRWLAVSAAYSEAFTEVQADVTGLQDQVEELGTEGRAKPVYYRGRICGTIRRLSVRLALFFLKAARPEKWRRLRTEHHSIKSGPALSHG